MEDREREGRREREREFHLKLQFWHFLKHSTNARVVASVHSVYT